MHTLNYTNSSFSYADWATPDNTPAVDQYACYLKRLYGDYKLPKDEWPPRVSDHYVNLALINHEKVPKSYEMDDFMKSTLHGTVDDLYFGKQTIAMDHLFQPKQFIERSSLKVRDQLVRSSTKQQFARLGGHLSCTERVQQTRKLLQDLDTQTQVSNALVQQNLALVQNRHAIAALHASIFQSHLHAQPVMVSSSNVKSLKVLLDGAPGVGKTTFCHIACKDWASGKIFADFKLMVYVPLRDDQVANGKEVADLFCYGPKVLRQHVALELEDTDGENALLVFDGWDELSPQQRGKNSLLCKIIIGRILPRCSILITSRPYASQWLRKPDVTNRHVEIFGFTEQQVKQCIYNMLSAAHARSLSEKLEVRSHLKTLCYVPTNLAMVIYIYTRTCDLPSTLTGIFDAFITNALLRYLQEYDKSSEPIMHLPSRNALPTDVLEMYRAMCLLAYHGLQQDKMVFSKEEVQAYHSELTTSSNTLGLITAFKGFTESGIDLKYQFLHLTIQEFLAAEALSEEKPEVQTKFVVDHVHDTRYRTMFHFLVGKCSVEGVESVLRLLFLTSVNGKDKERLLFLCHLLNEAHDPEFYRAVGRNTSHQSIKLVFPDNISLLDAIVIGKFLSLVGIHVKCLDMYTCNDDLSGQKLALITTNMSENCSGTLIEELKLQTGVRCSINEVTPFIRHPIFSHLSALKINLPTVPDTVTKLCSVIASMPKLTKVEIFLQPPTENVHLAINNIFTELSQNPNINYVRIFLTSMTMPQLLDDKSAEAMIEMIEKRSTVLSLKIDVALFGTPFMKKFFGGYLGTSNKISELNIYEKIPTSRRSMNRNDGRITGSKAVTLFAALKTNQSIASLKLSDSELLFATPEASTALEEMLCTNTALRSLHFRNCGMNTQMTSAVSKALQVNGSLTELILDKVEEGIGPVLNSLATSPSTLCTLSLRECHINNADEPSLTALLTRNTLKSLDLTSNDLGPEAATSLFSTLKDNSSLETLDLSYSRGLDDGDTEALSAAIEEAFSKNNTLKVLRLSHSNIPRLTVQGIANALANGSSLAEVNIEQSKVTMSGVQKLFIALQTNASLKKLMLRENITLNHTTTKELNKMVAQNGTLTTLTIKFSSMFSEAGSLENFIKALHFNETLSTLGVNGLEVAQFDTVNFDRIKKRRAIIAIDTH